MRLALDTDRVIATLRALSRFGAQGRGVCRPALNPEDMAARQWLAGQMREAGLDAGIDAVGNVHGRAPGVSRAVLLGSHADSVPTGGWLDGALGVVYAIETARAWRAQHPNAPVGLDVVAFSDEEGRYMSCLGSRRFCGLLDDAALDKLGHDGIGFRDAARSAGLPAGAETRLDPARHLAYFEAHIEQGPILDQTGTELGIVTGIAGMQRHLVRFAGRADHAGTTPMAMRQDAAMAAYAFAVDLDGRLRAAAGPGSVWNFGALELKPGVANVVAKQAELTVEFRDLSAAMLDGLAASLRGCVAAHDGQGQVRVSARLQNTLAPAPMDEGLRQCLAAQARRHKASHMDMPSGAIHDAMLLARHIPTAMLFVPSIDGRSHTPVEDTAEHHIALGARVYADAVAQTASALA